MSSCPYPWREIQMSILKEVTIPELLKMWQINEFFDGEFFPNAVTFLWSINKDFKEPQAYSH